MRQKPHARTASPELADRAAELDRLVKDLAAFAAAHPASRLLFDNANTGAASCVFLDGYADSRGLVLRCYVNDCNNGDTEAMTETIVSAWHRQPRRTRASAARRPRLAVAP